MHIAIVSYMFPPSKYIGGRRWAKFSKYLRKLNKNITVLTADENTHIDWYEKEFEGIDIITIPKKYPKWLSGYTSSFFEKFLYFLYTRVLNKITNVNFFDNGFSWKKTILEALEKLHQQKPIDILIVTGGPFSLLFYGSIFKEKHKEIFLVSDFRDPWTWGNLYGIPHLKQKMKNFQEFCEKKTVENSDMVCFPTRSMGDFLKRKYKNCESKLYLLPHAFEPEKFPMANSENERKGFIYGGAIYDGLEEYFKKLISILAKNPDSGFSWEIYTGRPYPILQSKDIIGGKITLNEFIPEEALFAKIKNSSAYLVFFPETDKDLISTKFFEIIYSETPILYIGEEGEVAKFIRENRIGVHILPENMEQELPQYLSGKVPFEPRYFDVNQYTFENVTKDFLNELNKNLINKN